MNEGQDTQAERAERPSPRWDQRDDLRIRLARSLTNHAPISNTIVTQFEVIRQFAKELGDEVTKRCPISREQSLALTHLEETVMWAIKAIALNQEETLRQQGLITGQPF